MSKEFQQIRRRWLAGDRSDQETVAANIEYRLSLAFIEARRELGLTQREVAERAGLSVRTISRLESGDIPVIHQLDAMLRAMGLRLEVSLEPLHPEGECPSGNT